MKGWGSTTRAYPGSINDDDGDLDRLLKTASTVARHSHDPLSAMVAETPQASGLHNNMTIGTVELQSAPLKSPIKKEDSLNTSVDRIAVSGGDSAIMPQVKQEDEPEVVFKKRKAKQIRQR